MYVVAATGLQRDGGDAEPDGISGGHVGGGVKIVLGEGEEVGEGLGIFDDVGGDGTGETLEAWQVLADAVFGEDFVDQFDAGFVDEGGFDICGDVGVGDGGFEFSLDLVAEFALTIHVDPIDGFVSDPL